MKGKVLVVFASMLLLSSVFGARLVTKVRASTVHHVYPWQSIQEAINLAQFGDTIFVHSGTYYENVVVNKSVSLIGENKYNTIIDGSGTGRVVWIDPTESEPRIVNITGFTIQNGGSGVYTSLGWFNVSNNIIKNNLHGIEGYLVGCIISNNDIFSNKWCGIVLTDWSSGNMISGNNVSNNGCGIYLATFFPNTLRNNNISNNTHNFGVSPIMVLEMPYWRHDIDTSNTVDGKPIYWWVNQQNKEIPSDAGYVGVVSSKNITVRDLNLTKNIQGVFFANTTGSTITNVTLSNNHHGITLFRSNNNTIFPNNFIDNTEQVYIETSGYPNVWDYGYPSGGNYWSDHNHPDLYRGPYQNETRSDGIVDDPYVIDADNIDRYPLTKPYGGPHDIGIPSLTTSKTIFEQGYNLRINLTIVNYGVDTENFNFTAYANTIPIAKFTNITLTSRNSTLITFEWNTTGVPYGYYTITATATPVPGETDTADNTYKLLVVVTRSPDVNGDQVVNVLDVILCIINLGPVPPKPPECDVNGDGQVNILDMIIVLLSLG